MTTLGQGQRWTLGPEGQIIGPEVEAGQFYDVLPVSELWEANRRIECLEAELRECCGESGREIDECLEAARTAVRRSDEAGGNETEPRELRAALRALIQAVARLAQESRS